MSVIIIQYFIPSPASRLPRATYCGKYLTLDRGSFIRTVNKLPHLGIESRMRNEPTTITAHTCLRGIAATTVVIAHLNLISLFPESSLLKRIYPVFLWHNQCVDLFFILSGFILNWVYVGAGRLRWGEYAAARIARICPLFYLTLAFMIATDLYSFLFHGIITNDLHFFRFISNALMLSGLWGDAIKNTINTPSWSVCVEMFMYFTLFPILCCIEKRLQKNLWKLGFLIVCVIGTQFCYCSIPYVESWRWLGRGIFGFSTGFICCTLWRSRKSSEALSLYGAAAALLAIMSIMGILSSSIMLACFPVVVVASAENAGVIAEILNTRMLKWLGERSYSIYLWHFPLIIFFHRYLLYNHATTAGHYSLTRRILATSLVILFTFAGAELSYSFFERPARKWIRGLAQYRRIGILKQNTV